MTGKWISKDGFNSINCEKPDYEEIKERGVVLGGIWECECQSRWRFVGATKDRSDPKNPDKLTTKWEPYLMSDKRSEPHGRA